MRNKRPVKDPSDLIAKKEVHNAWFLWERVLTKVVDAKSAPTNPEDHKKPNLKTNSVDVPYLKHICLNTTKWKILRKVIILIAIISLCASSLRKVYIYYFRTLCEQKYLSHKYLNDGTRPTLDYKGPRLIWKILINPYSLVGFL